MLDSVITNGTVVNHDGRSAVDVGVKDGRVALLGAHGSLPDADRVIDASGKYVLPGAIDPHVHLGLYTDLESDFETETRSAVLGGVTFFKHMIIESGPIAPAFESTRSMGEQRSYADFALDVAMIHDVHIPELPEYDQIGISSYKFLLAYKGSEGEDLGIRSCDDGYLYHGLSRVAEVGFPATARLHCENFDIIVTLRDKLKAEGRDGLKAWADARPRFVEAADVNRAAWLANYVGAPICTVHISSAESVDVIADAKAKGYNILGETCPQYLYFTWDSPIGALGKYNPPIKDQESVDRLWEGIRDGTMESIGTDHAWSPLAEKQGTNIWDALLGFGGVGIMFPFMLSEGVNKGRITLERAVAVTSYNTAKWYGFTPRKGVIAVGADADINVVDLDLKKTVTADLLNAGADWTPYEGMEVTGWPVLTMVRGGIVAEEGQIAGDPGIGRFVPARV